MLTYRLGSLVVWSRIKIKIDESIHNSGHTVYGNVLLILTLANTHNSTPNHTVRCCHLSPSGFESGY